jgi:hypothetical protein
MTAATFERCPKAMLRDELAEAREYVEDALVFREHGLPPRDGGLDSQPGRWVDALAIVDQEIATVKAQAVTGGR